MDAKSPVHLVETDSNSNGRVRLVFGDGFKTSLPGVFKSFAARPAQDGRAIELSEPHQFGASFQVSTISLRSMVDQDFSQQMIDRLKQEDATTTLAKKRASTNNIGPQISVQRVIEWLQDAKQALSSHHLIEQGLNLAHQLSKTLEELEETEKIG
jgi:hypothetical protein